MEVAVVSRRFGLVDNYGPFKGVVYQLNVAAPSGDTKNRKTAVTIYDREGVAISDYYLDGKNIIGLWCDHEAEVAKKYEAFKWEQTRARVQAEVQAKARQEKRDSINRVYALLAVLGVTKNAKECPSYGLAFSLNDSECNFKLFAEVLQKTIVHNTNLTTEV